MKLPQPITDQLRDWFRQRAQPAVPGALKQILLIGAKIESGKLCIYDQIKFDWTLITLIKLGIPVDPNFDVELANRAKAQGGENFLSGAYQGDLVIVRDIFNPPDGIGADDGDFGIAAEHYQKGIWYDTALKSGAKVLVVQKENFTTINASHFQGPDLTLLYTESDTAIFVRSDYAGPIKPEFRVMLEAPTASR